MMLRCIYNLVAFAILLQSALAASPRAALLPNGQSLYRNGQPFAPSTSLGPWSIVQYEDDGANYTAGPQAPAADGRDWLQAGTLPAMSIVVNDVETPLVFDPSITKTGIYRAKQTELQVESYPTAYFCRLRFRVLATDKINSLALRIANVPGREERFNLTARDDWNGRIKTDLLCVYLLDALEKYPRGYSIRNGSLDLFLHTNTLPKNVSKEGVPNLEAYLTGTLSTALVPEYATYLTSDPAIKNAAIEIDVANQVSRVSDTYVSMDFWLSNEPVKTRCPLVLLDNYESPIWSKIKPGLGNANLLVAETSLLELATHKLAAGPRGSILYGDFSEQPLSVTYYRCRGNDHYFWTTAAWRAFLRTGKQEWYDIARVFQNYVRDSAWRDGAQDHAKGLLPWSGTTTVNGHWCNSESLCLASLTGDYLSKMEYDRWLAAFVPPTSSNRESQVACRMARVAAWYTGQPKWTQVADTIETRITAEVERVKATLPYQTYGVGLPTGPNWHPLAFNKPLNLDRQRYEGFLAVREFAGKQKLDQIAVGIQHYLWPDAGKEVGFGPLGEGYSGLQLEDAYSYYRGRKPTTNFQPIYGNKNNYATIFVEKTDGNATQLRIVLGCRKSGDIIPQFVYLTDPSGRRTELTAGKRFPTYVDTGQGWVPSKDFPATTVNSWPGVLGAFSYSGPPGRYKVEIGGNGYGLVLAPISSYREWQDCSGDFQDLGQDYSGNWPAGSVLVGSSPEK